MIFEDSMHLELHEDHVSMATPESSIHMELSSESRLLENKKFH